MNLLAIETATEACSAALAINGEIIEKYEVAPRQHARLILGMVDQLLTESDQRLIGLDALAFGRGPGSFTGVRIASGVIQGLAFGANLPVIPISTLAVLAQSAPRTDAAVLAAMDARMGEVYWGLFRKDAENIAQAVGAEQVSRPEQVKVPKGHHWHGIGSAWRDYQAILQNNSSGKIISVRADCLPRARHVLELAVREFRQGNTVSAAQALPVYLRDKVTFQGQSE